MLPERPWMSVTLFDEIQIYSPDQYDRHICTIRSDGTGLNDERARAIANLIVAAPELLDALRKCRGAIDLLMGDTDNLDDTSPEMQAMHAANAAISKAEGRAGVKKVSG